MKFQQESIAECFDEAMPLMEEHWEEIAHYKDVPLEPDYEFYLAAETAALLRVYTARNDEGKLIGYAVYFIRRAPHYKSVVYGVQDVLFISKGHRGTGGRFILWCDEQLKLDGVNFVFHHIKAKHNFGKLLERLGYNLIDLIYSRRL